MYSLTMIEYCGMMWPVLRAFMEGREVEYKISDGEEWFSIEHPNFTLSMTNLLPLWRIAPKKTFIPMDKEAIYKFIVGQYHEIGVRVKNTTGPWLHPKSLTLEKLQECEYVYILRQGATDERVKYFGEYKYFPSPVIFPPGGNAKIAVYDPDSKYWRFGSFVSAYFDGGRWIGIGPGDWQSVRVSDNSFEIDRDRVCELIVYKDLKNA